jgi:hypothetical protein
VGEGGCRSPNVVSLRIKGKVRVRGSDGKMYGRGNLFRISSDRRHLFCPSMYKYSGERRQRERGSDEWSNKREER